jgi:hypothetical protein
MSELASESLWALGLPSVRSRGDAFPSLGLPDLSDITVTVD